MKEKSEEMINSSSFLPASRMEGFTVALFWKGATGVGPGIRKKLAKELIWIRVPARDWIACSRPDQWP